MFEVFTSVANHQQTGGPKLDAKSSELIQAAQYNNSVNIADPEGL